MLDIYEFGDIKRISPEAPVPFGKKESISKLGGALNENCFNKLGDNVFVFGRSGHDDDLIFQQDSIFF